MNSLNEKIQSIKGFSGHDAEYLVISVNLLRNALELANRELVKSCESEGHDWDHEHGKTVVLEEGGERYFDGGFGGGEWKTTDRVTGTRRTCHRCNVSQLGNHKSKVLQVETWTEWETQPSEFA